MNPNWSYEKISGWIPVEITGEILETIPEGKVEGIWGKFPKKQIEDFLTTFFGVNWRNSSGNPWQRSFEIFFRETSWRNFTRNS